MQQNMKSLYLKKPWSLAPHIFYEDVVVILLNFQVEFLAMLVYGQGLK
jgi:hypothetical protein